MWRKLLRATFSSNTLVKWKQHINVFCKALEVILNTVFSPYRRCCILYVFSLETAFYLCTHRTSLPSHQQLENFPTFFLWTATKENIISDTWANSNKALKCGRYQILCLEWSLVLRGLPGRLIFILQGEHMTRLLWYLESLSWSIPKVFREISEAVSKQYFPFWLTLSSQLDKLCLSLRLTQIFPYPVPTCYKEIPMIMKSDTTVQVSVPCRFKNEGPKSNTYFSVNLKDRICSISPFLSHFFKS